MGSVRNHVCTQTHAPSFPSASSRSPADRTRDSLSGTTLHACCIRQSLLRIGFALANLPRKVSY